MHNVYCWLRVLAVIKISSNHVMSQRIGSVSFQLTNALVHLKKTQQKQTFTTLWSCGSTNQVEGMLLNNGQKVLLHNIMISQ